MGISLWYPDDTAWTDYYFIKNLQGDVLSVHKASDGTLAASYTYDSWGNILSKSGTLASVNPFRYRSYYFDEQMWFYYLESRYYDPAIGRFINADALVSTAQGVLGYNMFAYCGNNPVNLIDDAGDSASLAANPNSSFYEDTTGGGGGGGMLIALGEVGTWGFESIIRIAIWTIAATAYSSVYTSAYAQNTAELRFAEQIPPDDQYQYWEAFLSGKKVCLGEGLTLWEASFRVACGQNVICANQDAALWIVKINRYHNAIGPEVGRGEDFLYHYHPHRNTKVHIWFYGGVAS